MLDVEAGLCSFANDAAIAGSVAPNATPHVVEPLGDVALIVHIVPYSRGSREGAIDAPRPRTARAARRLAAARSERGHFNVSGLLAFGAPAPVGE